MSGTSTFYFLEVCIWAYVICIKASRQFSKSVANWKSSDSIPVKLKIRNPYSAAI